MEPANLNFKDLRADDKQLLNPRDRILKAANHLFNQYGVTTVGVDWLIAESEVSKRTFYKYFPSKSDLISAYLESKDWLRFNGLAKQLEQSGTGPLEQILAIFDFLEAWFSEPDFNGCAFARGLSDFNNEGSMQLRCQALGHFNKWSEFIGSRLDLLMEKEKSQAVLPALLSLLTGSVIVAQGTGDPKVARYNKNIAEILLNQRT